MAILDQQKCMEYGVVDYVRMLIRLSRWLKAVTQKKKKKKKKEYRVEEENRSRQEDFASHA
jgi:hypothetical protein